MEIKNGIYEVEQGSAMTIDWQQVRIQAAIEAMQGICANPNSVMTDIGTITEYSVIYADTLVEKLKGE